MFCSFSSSVCSFCVYDDSVVPASSLSWSLTLSVPRQAGGLKQLTTTPQGSLADATLSHTWLLFSVNTRRTSDSKFVGVQSGSLFGVCENDSEDGKVPNRACSTCSSSLGMLVFLQLLFTIIDDAVVIADCIEGCAVQRIILHLATCRTSDSKLFAFKVDRCLVFVRTTAKMGISLAVLVTILFVPPGHVDFSSVVTAALRIVGGTVVAVDYIDGCAVPTVTVPSQAFAVRVFATLSVFKVDHKIIGSQMEQ